MSDNSNITRDDLVAVAYVVYSTLHATLGKEKDSPQDFSTNCKKAFAEFSEMSGE